MADRRAPYNPETETRAVPDAPRLPRLYLPRQRLWTQLDKAPVDGITLLVAPAGAGKTLGVAGWLQTSPFVSTARWVTADSSWSTQRLLDVIDTSTDDSALPALVVVDDAHLLPRSVVRALDERLNADPESLRLMLLSRWDLPVSRLVPALLGNYSVLRGDLLRLSESECATLIAEHGRTDSIEVIQAITERTQGWCAAVVLAARAISATPDPVAAARRYSRSGSSAVDQLMSEVFLALQPAERHLLLCLAGDETVTAETAAHLSHDPGAGDVLAALENTGLLVTRLLDTSSPADADLEGSERYRIHPLLGEVVRRRVVAGGVDVSQAQRTIRRAVRLDAARGDLSKALTRLVALNQPTEAASVVAEHGPTLLMQGQGFAIADFARHYPTQVEANPQVWFAIALERWFSDDIATAAHWLDRRALHLYEHGAEGDPGVELACVRLFRALLGSESAADAAAHAHIVVSRALRTSRPQPLLPLLLTELGMVRAQLGHLRLAEVNLTAGVALSRAHGMVPLTLSGLSHLALTLYMQGRERASIEVANEVLLLPGRGAAWLPRFSLERAQIVHDLATMSDLPSLMSQGPPLVGGPDAPAVHSGDALTQFWARIRQSRLALAAGAVVTAEQMLQVPASGLPIPEHLRVTLVIERGFLASMGADARTLQSLAQELIGLRAPGEAALLDGLSHELEGDRKAALAAYDRAEARVTYEQPATRALALACAAQLLDALGSHTEAMERLREAATVTEVRRNAVPFLGWSRQGTPIGSLLDRLREEVFSEWINDLAELARQTPNIATVFAPTTANLRERVRAAGSTLAPTLSSRERDVLNELARGATYADIAANLFVSENTVKTHVSSLYGKLGATRRSEALAAARNQRLL